METKAVIIIKSNHCSAQRIEGEPGVGVRTMNRDWWITDQDVSAILIWHSIGLSIANTGETLEKVKVERWRRSINTDDEEECLAVSIGSRCILTGITRDVMTIINCLIELNKVKLTGRNDEE